MKYEPISKQLFVKNRKKFMAQMRPGSIAVFNSNDIYPVSADSTMPFEQHSDIFYLSGADQEETILVLFPDAIDKRHCEILFVRETNDHIAVWEGAKLTKTQASAVSGIKTVYWLSDFDKVFFDLMTEADTIYFNTNEHYRQAVETQTREDRFIKQCKEDFPAHQWAKSNPILQNIRGVKEQEELEEHDKQIEPVAADTFSGYGSSIASSYVEESNVPSNRSNRSAQQPLLIPGESPNKYNNLPVDRSLEGESPTGSGNRYFPMIVVASLGLLAASIGILSVISRNKPQIAIQDAVINGRTIAINSPLMGKLTKVNYSRGMAVDKDAVIAVVEPAASTNVNQAQIREQIRLKQQQKTLAQQSLDFLERSLKSLEQSVIAQSFESITPLLESLHQNQINYQEIAVKTARIREDAAKSSYESLKKLLEEGKIPQSQLDSAKSSWELAKLAIEEINANLSGIRQEYSLLKQQIANSKQQQGSTISAQTSLLKQQSSTQKLNLELLDEELGELEENLAQAVADTAQSRQITLRAPVAGSFHSQNYLAGEVVEALGTIATIVDCKNLWIEAVVDPQVTAKISPEQTVLVSVGQENLTLEGQISRVESLNSRSVINSSRQTAITTQAPQSLQSKNYSRVVVSLPDEVNQLSDQEYCGVGQTATLSISGDRGSLANNWYPQWLAEIFSGT